MQEHRCKTSAKSGEPCQAAATEGGLCCFPAHPDQPPSGAESVAARVSNPLPKLDKVSAVRAAVEKLTVDVLAGKLHPRTAAGLATALEFATPCALGYGTWTATREGGGVVGGSGI